MYHQILTLRRLFPRILCRSHLRQASHDQNDSRYPVTISPRHDELAIQTNLASLSDHSIPPYIYIYIYSHSSLRSGSPYPHFTFDKLYNRCTCISYQLHRAALLHHLHEPLLFMQLLSRFKKRGVVFAFFLVRRGLAGLSLS